MKCIENNNKLRKTKDGLFSVVDAPGIAAYDNKAKAYERIVRSKLYNQVIWGAQPKDYIHFAEKAILDTNGIILDVGCGGLAHTAAIYANRKQDCILLDQSIEMLRIAAKRLKDLCQTIPQNICLLQADAFQLPFEDTRFENLASFGMIHCFDNKEAFLTEAFRVLKPGGNFYFTTMTSDRFTGRLYMRFLRKMGAFGEPINTVQTLALFKSHANGLSHYRVGSMLFIYGQKNED